MPAVVPNINPLYHLWTTLSAVRQRAKALNYFNGMVWYAIMYMDSIGWMKGSYAVSSVVLLFFFFFFFLPSRSVRYMLKKSPLAIFFGLPLGTVLGCCCDTFLSFTDAVFESPSSSESTFFSSPGSSSCSRRFLATVAFWFRILFRSFISDADVGPPTAGWSWRVAWLCERYFAPRPMLQYPSQLAPCRYIFEIIVLNCASCYLPTWPSLWVTGNVVVVIITFFAWLSCWEPRMD